MTEASKEYAEALFALAMEKGEEGEVLSNLHEIAKVFEDNPEVLEFLSAPSVPVGERIEFLTKCFKGVGEYVLHYLCLLCEKSRIKCFEGSVQEFEKLWNAKEKIVKAKVRSVVRLTEEEKTALCDRLSKKTGGKVALECEIDPTLIGGVIVEIDGRVMDGSVRRNLREIKEVMMHE